MKMILAFLMTATASLALAADPAPTSKDILACTVADGAAQPQVSVLVTVHFDASADFVIASINDKGQTFRMFTQAGKGEVEASLAQGSVVFMLLDENFSQDAGVIRNSGVMVVNAGNDGSLSGLLVAHSNIYPLTCKAN